ncbi:MAG: metal-dependent hydrolase [Rhodospirillales bacterium]|nr:metal-dependent hydrolase [Rhodospirillales bacterium]
MDSVTQFTLGAVVGVAVMGRRVGLRKAAIAGGLLATLPDLDVFWPNDDPIDRFVTHRSATHSLLVHSLITPVLGEGLMRLVRGLRDNRRLAYLAVFLCLTTHALLDALTIYGTQLFWPVWKQPVGLGSVFIIDPLYTLPLLVITVWALVQGNWSTRFGRGLVAALLISTGYLGWGIAAQAWVLDQGNRELARLGIVADRVIATPVPFSSLFWRIIATDARHDYSVYVPLLGGRKALTTFRNQRLPAELVCWDRKMRDMDGPLKTLADFSDGFYRLDREQNRIRYSDLRMGLSHTYAFQFTLADQNGPAITLVTPERYPAERNRPGDMAWLWAGIQGQKMIRPSEQQNLVEDLQTVAATGAPPAQGGCG